MTKYYALIGPKLDGPALNSAMTACSIEPSIRQVPRLYVNRMGITKQPEDSSLLTMRRFISMNYLP